MELIIGTANFSKQYGLENKMVKKKNLKNIFKKIKRTKNDLEFTLGLILKYNIINQCYKKAEHFINLASNSLSIFPNSEEKKVLENLTTFSLERSF